ncbi:uncharacterized protein LOC115967862 isoform X2 [Quercus lobata]|uniref:uncharacterized protein LOC115967862 isoform X2 n=1 Tax=Quercus lobata TaxID=97700 RepID=UPI001244C62F|nr:uncharacterized protein LOC115967862 isoform X2 [Quercus lobata]
MAMVATTTAPPPPPSLLNQDSLSHIDLSTLSQSELHSLSLCSTSPSPSTFPSPLLPPKIDRSQFNESAGSRRQTYSRPSISAGHRRRVAGLLPTPKLPPIPADDPERVENRYIINHLKQFLNQDPRFDRFDLTLTLPSISSISIAGVNNNNNNNEKVSFGNGKRKRGRKPKLKALHLEEDYRKLEIVNKNGVVVDLEKLANAEDPFGEELRRRTVGMESEEALLGFMRELGGQWGSRRKKRKIVDAAAFGDALPVGWKLLLGIRRRDGRASIYCRRYISPTGQHFVSCKEAASYLQSFFGLRDAQWPSSQMVENIQQDYRLTSETLVAVTQKDEDRRQEVISSSTAARVPISSEQPKEATLLGMDNLADVQIRDLFECHKCSMTFDEKDTYLQHLLSYHQRTTRRYRLGSSVGDGVIIKDGKYECQFCHKVFLERRRYNGHVGIHVRNYVRRVEEVPGTTPLPMRIESPTRDDVPSRISKMDALIEIAQNSILETSTVRPNNEPNGGSTPNQLNVVSTQEIPASNFNNDTNLGSPLSGPEMDDDSSDRTLDQDLNQLDGDHISTAENMEKTTDEVVDSKMDCCLGATTVLPDKDQNANTNEAFCKKDSLAFVNNENDISGVEQEGVPEGHLVAQFENQIICENRDNINLSCTSTLDHSKPCEVNNNIELKVGVGGINEGPSKNVVMEIVQQTSEENILQHGVSDSPMSPEQLLQKFSTFNATSDKGDQLHSVDQRHDNLTGFEELRLDEIEPLKYSTATGQESLSLQEVPMDLTYSVDMEREYASSVQFESEEVMLNMGGRHQLTTVCVWCGVEFNHEAVDAELQSDSVGFMCPTCKAKISGQYISGSPMTSHRL